MMNACIVGYGAIGPVHAESLKQIKGATLYAVCDCDENRANLAADKYGCIKYLDFDVCVKDPAIDVIHICTPHYLHFEMICKALSAGKKVVVEKPAVMKREELDILFQNYDITKIFPVVQNRKNACVAYLRKMVATDTNLGKLLGVKGVLTWFRDAEYYRQAQWRGTLSYEGGGALINQAVHTLDLMIYFGGRAKKIDAAMRNVSLKGEIEVEDTVDAYIQFANGARGVFYATNAYCDNSPMQLELEFEKKTLSYFGGMLLVNGEILCRDSSELCGKAYWGNGHQEMLSDVYENTNALTLYDIKDTMDAMFAIYESAKSGKEILLL